MMRKGSVATGAALAVLVMLGLLSSAQASERCSSLFTIIQLAGYHSMGPFYVASEDQGGTFKVQRIGDACESTWTEVFYSVQHETSDEGDISLTPSGSVRLYSQDDGTNPGEDIKQVQINVEGPINQVEKARIRIDSAESNGSDQPSFYERSAPLYILDTNGPAGFSLGETESRGSEGLTAVIPVFRTGPVSGSGSVSFEIEPITAIPGEDYTIPSTTTVNFSGTTRTGTISIPLKSDGIKDPNEQFRVRLVGGTGPQSETVVTILDTTLEDLRPKGRIHHPKQSFKYPQNYPWLNEIHIFTKSVDERRAPVDRAQLAIRKRLKSGACAWWTSTGFRGGSCTQTRWFAKNIRKPADNYFKYVVKQRFPLSVGDKSRVRDYKIWGRWYDGENRVSSLKKGRNMNVFEVIKPSEACRKNPFAFRKCKPVRP